MLRGVTTMMAYICSVPREFDFVSAARRCHATFGFSVISFNNNEYSWRFMYFRGCAHVCDVCVCVEPCVKVVFHCVFTVVCAASHVHVSALLVR